MHMKDITTLSPRYKLRKNGTHMADRKIKIILPESSVRAIMTWAHLSIREAEKKLMVGYLDNTASADCCGLCLYKWWDSHDKQTVFTVAPGEYMGDEDKVCDLEVPTIVF